MEILKFSTPWCGGCRIIAPYFKEFSLEYNIQEINAEEDKEMVEKFKVKNLPTVIIMKDGVEVDRLVGRNSKTEYIERFKKQN